MVVVKSTVVPQTTEGVVTPILEEASGKKAGVDFGVGMNPEFLREGKAIYDFQHPDRIVIGGDDKKAQGIIKELYAGYTCPYFIGRHQDRRDDQVRLKCFPGDEDLIL